MTSPHPFRFALQVGGPALRDRAALQDRARQAAALGYEELYVPDHIGSVDPFVAVAIAADAEPTIRVGTLVLNNELHHPAMLARTAATLDRLTGGRLILGVGSGYAQSEHDATGITLRAPRARVDRLRESLQAVRSLLDTGAVNLSSDHMSLSIEDLGIRPMQERVPFLIGGHGRRVVRVAADHADVFQHTGLTHGTDGAPVPGGFDLASTIERRQWLDEAAGPRASQIVRSTLVQHTVIGDDAAAARAEVAAELGLPEPTVAESPFLLMGTVAEIVDKLERLRADVGISHVVIRDAEGFAPVVAALRGR